VTTTALRGRAAVGLSGEGAGLGERERFVEPEHQVQVLDRLPLTKLSSALTHVIGRRFSPPCAADGRGSPSAKPTSA
jgi:hypothetical protein